MKKKWLPLLVIILLGIIVYLVQRSRDNDSNWSPPGSNSSDAGSEYSTNRRQGFDRRISYLHYSHHAKCRMDCRQISAAEVEAIMQEGKINYKKSDINNSRCPRYAVEGITQDRQRVRIVFAQCIESTTVVTAIDLETDFACECPGDDDGYKNKKR